MGPAESTAVRTPTPETERLFEASFNQTLDLYRELLRQQRDGTLKLANDNFDVGSDTGPGKYKLNDGAHAELVGDLRTKNLPELRRSYWLSSRDFYSDPSLPYANKKDHKAQARLQAALERLKSLKKSENAAGAN